MKPQIKKKHLNKNKAEDLIQGYRCKSGLSSFTGGSLEVTLNTPLSYPGG